MTETIHLDVAHDGGNGYTKDRIERQNFVFPSVLSRVLPGSELQTIPEENSALVSRLLDNFINHMDITVKSDGLQENGRYLVGQAAIDSGVSVFTYNVSSSEGKNQTDISLISLLSLVSYFGLHKFYQEKGVLPSNLHISVDKLATALPIDEIRVKKIRTFFKNRFIANQHLVIINNFSNKIYVNVTFRDLALEPEGIIGELGLISDPRMVGMYRNDGIFDAFKEKYGLGNFSGKDIQTVGNILGIDIGEGTTDFSVVNGTEAIPKVNTSILKGIGTIAQNAIRALRTEYPVVGQINRQEFMRIAFRGNDKESQAYRGFLNDQLIDLGSSISEEVKTIYNKMNGQINMIVFFGGGAITLKPVYEEKFAELIDQLSPFGVANILWVDPEYAQYLNLDGLQFRLDSLNAE